MKNVLITGGSGQVGQHLTQFLEKKGMRVSWLSRNPESCSQKAYKWDLNAETIDSKALEDVDVIIHLAGAGIMDKRWSKHYKQTLISSRVVGLNVLRKHLEGIDRKVKVISAGGVNYYGYTSSSIPKTEQSEAGDDFIGHVCVKWENAVHKLESAQVEIAILRIGVVLGEGMSALEKMAQPVKFGVGGRLGSGNQLMPWVHIEDLCRVFYHFIDSDHKGIYNTIARCDTQKDIVKSIANHYKRPLLAPPVPGWFLKLILGESAKLLLNGYPVQNEKIKATGFEFIHDTVDDIF